MALFKATVKSSRTVNGVRLEKGMTVDFPSQYSSPLITNGGKEVIDAFMRRYGVDIKKANAVSSVYIEVVKIS
ncbi:DUF6140 family protein [Chitinophaga sancti]|uniref:DUF6140 family protein n=1 Tax=Chitinophaga sancti TaxID=1004 RepID=UPI002A7583C5|nr:DUF6140 family protein [Chitinophaga sancti]WPQ65532.1 DUF6140 family protein [Chitinophaga sancti]